MIPPIVVDTGGQLRALARTPDLLPSFPAYQAVLTTASQVIVPALVLAERRKIYRVLTTDRRDFSAIRIGPRFSRALDLLP